MTGERWSNSANRGASGPTIETPAKPPKKPSVVAASVRRAVLLVLSGWLTEGLLVAALRKVTGTARSPFTADDPVDAVQRVGQSQHHKVAGERDARVTAAVLTGKTVSGRTAAGRESDVARWKHDGDRAVRRVWSHASCENVSRTCRAHCRSAGSGDPLSLLRPAMRHVDSFDRTWGRDRRT